MTARDRALERATVDSLAWCLVVVFIAGVVAVAVSTLLYPAI